MVSPPIVDAEAVETQSAIIAAAATAYATFDLMHMGQTSKEAPSNSSFSIQLQRSQWL
jgi:hypothetical protein